MTLNLAINYKAGFREYLLVENNPTKSHSFAAIGKTNPFLTPLTFDFLSLFTYVLLRFTAGLTGWGMSARGREQTSQTDKPAQSSYLFRLVLKLGAQKSTESKPLILAGVRQPLLDPITTNQSTKNFPDARSRDNS